MYYLIREKNTSDISTVVQDMNVVLYEMYELKWWAALNRPAAIRGNGRNKLRTYRSFKQSYQVESHLKNIMPYKYCSAFSKFRCGLALTCIETRKYENLAGEPTLCIM